jgi:hypothetical protein
MDTICSKLKGQHPHHTWRYPATMIQLDGLKKSFEVHTTTLSVV